MLLMRGLSAVQWIQSKQAPPSSPPSSLERTANGQHPGNHWKTLPKSRAQMVRSDVCFVCGDSGGLQYLRLREADKSGVFTRDWGPVFL